MEQSSAKVIRIRGASFKSRQNFGGAASRKRGESNFLRQFERAHFLQAGAGIAADEFSLSQYGVADLVWVAWKHSPDEEAFSAVSLQNRLARRHLFAFEAKLSHWQRALQQAFRYRYFADKAIVVMPSDSAASAVRNIEAFRNQCVGLWLFHRGQQKIEKVFTPVRVRAFNREARNQAFLRISVKVNFSKF